ncbi:unnamed protein product [Peronospora destructor]|uniref:Uncharacterized protein n=1 Tax=Peronospora destructor TaxID=86335 RepID=A0AAV0UDM4_9STRA|nr:unnamed protein product [Peronospora destructor]
MTIEEVDKGLRSLRRAQQVPDGTTTTILGLPQALPTCQYAHLQATTSMVAALGMSSLWTVRNSAYAGSDPVVLVIVGTVLALIAIMSVLAVVVYSRRNRERACLEDPSTPSEPFIVGSLPEHPIPNFSLLDTDMSPDLWLEGQYRYSPNMSHLINSCNGTAILSDNKTIPMHDRLTVDAFPSSCRGRRGERGDAGRDQRGNARHGLADYGNSMLGYSVRHNSARGNSGSRGGNHVHSSRRDNSVRREGSILEDISGRRRRRKGTTPIVLYDENSTEECKSNSSRIHNHSRTVISTAASSLPRAATTTSS